MGLKLYEARNKVHYGLTLCVKPVFTHISDIKFSARLLIKVLTFVLNQPRVRETA